MEKNKMTPKLSIPAPALKPFLKWPGGKSKELKAIIPYLPEKIDRYYEPFVSFMNRNDKKTTHLLITNY